MADEVKENNKQLVCEIKIDAEMMRKIIDEKMSQIELDIQEIRAKAIDDFANWLYENHKHDLTDYVEWYLDEIAEQMKGGGNDVEIN